MAATPVRRSRSGRSLHQTYAGQPRDDNICGSTRSAQGLPCEAMQGSSQLVRATLPALRMSAPCSACRAGEALLAALKNWSGLDGN